MAKILCHYLKVSLFLLNFFCFFVYGREYVLEVSPAPNGFHITTNIPRVGDLQPATISFDDPHYDDPIPTVTFAAQNQHFLLTENCLDTDTKAPSPLNRLEIFLDDNGHIHVQQMSIIDDLHIKNTTKGGDIIFEGTKQNATYLTLEGRSFFNKTNLYVYSLTASFSDDFINDSELKIAKSELKAKNVTNNNQIDFFKYYNIWTINNLLQNNSKIIGNGSLTIQANKFLNDVHATIDLNGALEILPVTTSTTISHCSWSCILDNFATSHLKMFRNHAAGWRGGFLGDHEQQMCLQLKDHERNTFDQDHDCNEILLQGTVNADSLNMQAKNIVLHGAININKDCACKTFFVFRNSGSLFVKGAFELNDGDYFYNDIDSIICAGTHANIAVNKVAVNVSGAISGSDITIKADKFINARGAPTGFKQGENYKDHFNYKQAETFPLGYIYARKGDIAINVNNFLQEASVCIACNNINMTVAQQFSNAARELKEKCNKGIPGCTDESDRFNYETSTIAAGEKCVITINGITIDFNKSQPHYTIPNFYNSGTIQGFQILELDSNSDQTLLTNGFTHKLTLPDFSRFC